MLSVDVTLVRGEFELALELTVERAQCLALVGPSGAGKSTLLRVLAGLLAPARGRVECDGELWLDTAAGVCLPPERRSCGYVFQDGALFPHLSALENVAYGLFALPRAERRARAGALLDSLGLAGRAGAAPHELSGGERRRVALARALAPSPRALLLDEPLSALDVQTKAAVARELAAVLARAGVPTVLVTHDFQEAAVLADRVGVLDHGRLIQIGSAAELAAAPASAFVADLTGAVVLTGVARGEADGLTSIALDGGGELASVDRAGGRVSVCVHPWEIALEPAGSAATGSARNRLDAEIVSLQPVGNRVRVGLRAPQPLTAEITAASLERLGLARGDRVIATFKAAATRVVGSA